MLSVTLFAWLLVITSACISLCEKTQCLVVALISMQGQDVVPGIVWSPSLETVTALEIVSAFCCLQGLA